jgi:hypothetical protein
MTLIVCIDSMILLNVDDISDVSFECMLMHNSHG